MISLKLVLLILAFIMFVLAALGLQTPRVNQLSFVAIGLACWVLTLIVGGQ